MDLGKSKLSIVVCCCLLFLSFVSFVSKLFHSKTRSEFFLDLFLTGCYYCWSAVCSRQLVVGDQ